MVLRSDKAILRSCRPTLRFRQLSVYDRADRIASPARIANACTLLDMFDQRAAMVIRCRPRVSRDDKPSHFSGCDVIRCFRNKESKSGYLGRAELKEPFLKGTANVKSKIARSV